MQTVYVIGIPVECLFIFPMETITLTYPNATTGWVLKPSCWLRRKSMLNGAQLLKGSIISDYSNPPVPFLVYFSLRLIIPPLQGKRI